MTGARSLHEGPAGGGSDIDYRHHDPHIGRVVVSQEDLRRRVGELGAEITRDYGDRPPSLIRPRPSMPH